MSSMSSGTWADSTWGLLMVVLVVRRRLRRVGVVVPEIREGGRGRPRGPVDAVTDRRARTGVDEHGEEGVHDVVVQGPATAAVVWPPAQQGPFDLEEGTALAVRLTGVDDEVVTEDQLRQRMAAVVGHP